MEWLGGGPLGEVGRGLLDGVGRGLLGSGQCAPGDKQEIYARPKRANKTAKDSQPRLMMAVRIKMSCGG